MVRLTFNTPNNMTTEKKKGGRPKGIAKTGGRVAGTPNKVSGKVRSILANVTGNYYDSDLFEKDLASLEPKERIQAMERFTAYIAPKLQATTLDVATETKKTIEDRLIALSGGGK
ncbi:hypothetical protein HMPREF9148_00168 [Prevotella sp. F0091]|nr:hypothetical protein HMPREF9148_00168 [Prevotella sp. F0091]